MLENIKTRVTASKRTATSPPHVYSAPTVPPANTTTPFASPVLWLQMTARGLSLSLPPPIKVLSKAPRYLWLRQKKNSTAVGPPSFSPWTPTPVFETVLMEGLSLHNNILYIDPTLPTCLDRTITAAALSFDVSRAGTRTP